MNLQQSLKEIITNIHENAHVTAVFGDPIEANGKVLVPVARVMYGIGGGMGIGTAFGLNIGNGQGEGLGAGVMTEPLGMVEITDEGVEYIEFKKKGSLAKNILFGVVVGLLVGATASTMLLTGGDDEEDGYLE